MGSSFGVDTDTGLIQPARQCISPNNDDRPDGAVPESLIVHGISLPPGEFGGSSIDRLFTNSLIAEEHPYFQEIIDLRVSSHVLISRLGVRTQYVSFDKRAWHAGESCYCGRKQCNDFSVGIELEGTDDVAYEPIQYERLAELVSTLRRAYPSLRNAEVVGHSDIAPGRKTDPGPYFEWALFKSLLQG